MVRAFSVMLSLALVLGLSGCVRETSVPGPDGESARLIHCAIASDCYERAAKDCGGQFVVRSGGPVGLREGSELVVSCKGDLAGQVPVTSAPVAPQREDSRTCEAASEHAAAFGVYWAQRASIKPLSSAPRQDDFISVCRVLPANVQRCLHEGYRASHTESCDAVLVRLEPRDRAKIDGLYLRAPQ